MQYIYAVYHDSKEHTSAPLFAYTQLQNAQDKCNWLNESALKQKQAEWQILKNEWDAFERNKEKIANAFANIPKYTARPFKKQMPTEYTGFQYCALELQE